MLPASEWFESDFLIRADNYAGGGQGYFQETGLIENIGPDLRGVFMATLTARSRRRTQNRDSGRSGQQSGCNCASSGRGYHSNGGCRSPLHQLGSYLPCKGRKFPDGRILLGCEMENRW